jgi:hypothetical protein
VAPAEGATITRYEVAAICERIMFVHKLYQQQQSPDAGFTDIPDGHWAASAVNIVVDHGLMAGREDGTFGGNETITRRQFAEVMSSLLQIAGIKPFYGSVGGIQMMLDHGLWDRDPDANYRPAEAETKADAYLTFARADALLQTK